VGRVDPHCAGKMGAGPKWVGPTRIATSTSTKGSRYTWIPILGFCGY